MNFPKEALESARNYYRYLEANKGGRINVEVNEIRRLQACTYELVLRQKIKSVDDVEICIQNPIIENTSPYFSDDKNRFVKEEHLRICYYDEQIPSVRIEVSREFKNDFDLLSANDIILVSDLKFLVKNVGNWYKNNGDDLILPSFVPGSTASPFTTGIESEEQLQAIDVALNSPVSYIWGPPGTGKTQIVLADCIMTHIQNGNAAYIVAPTNNAIEQTLVAVIASLKKIGKPIDCLYRLGTSSASFSREYGSICERFDRQSQIDNIQKSLNHMYEESKFTRRVKQIREAYTEFLRYAQNVNALEEEKNVLSESISNFTLRVSPINEQMREARKELSAAKSEIHRINVRLNSFLFKIKLKLFWFSSSIQYEKNSLEQQKADLESQINMISESIMDLEAQRNSLMQEYNKRINDIDALTKNISNCNANIKRLSCCVTGTFTNIDNIKASFEQELEKYKDTPTDTDVITQIENKEKELDRVKSLQKAEQKNRTIFAFTADYFFAHYESLKTAKHLSAPLSHIFMDEAAYCPMIKAAPLFAMNVPVTLFGDHMQLPPVCEADEDLLKQSSNNIFLWSLSAIDFPKIFEDNMSMGALFDYFSSNETNYSKLVKSAALTKTYRFGDNLAKILDSFVYKNGFSGSKDFNTSVTVIHAYKNSSDEKRTNTGEARAILEYLTKNPQDNFVVTTPYKNQRALLGNVLKGVKKKNGLRIERDDILTIHTSQGREWDTVILSVVDRKDMFFTDTTSLISNGLKIINTAISRAQKDLVIVCDINHWEQLSETQLIGSLVKGAIKK